MELTLYTRANCHLCDKAKAVIHAAAADAHHKVDLVEVDIDADPALQRRYNDDVPLLFAGTRELFRHTVDRSALAGFLRGEHMVPTLADERCVPCRGGDQPLREAELATLREALDAAWQVRDEHQLERHFEFPDFKASLALANRIGDVAEAEGHHPDLTVRWGSLEVVLWTHVVNGLSRADFVLAAKIDRLIE